MVRLSLVQTMMRLVRSFQRASSKFWSIGNGDISIRLAGWLSRVQFDDADDFSEGLALVKVAGDYGFVGRDGQLVVNFVIEPQFDEADSFSEGLALVLFRQKTGLYPISQTTCSTHPLAQSRAAMTSPFSAFASSLTSCERRRGLK